MTNRKAPAQRTQIRETLDDIAEKGAVLIRQERARDAFLAAWPRAVPLLLVVPIVLLAWTLANLWRGGEPPVSLWIAVLATVALPTLCVFVPIVVAESRSTARRQGLGLHDLRLDLGDRLRTADEFLASSKTSPFMEAAIADAWGPARHALVTPVAMEPMPWPGKRRHAALIFVAAGLLALPYWPIAGPLPPAATASEPGDLAEEPRNSTETETRTPEAKRGDASRSDAQTRRRSQPPGTSHELTVALEPKPYEAADASDRVLETQGKTRGGQPAFAPSTGRSERSRGIPGTQAPTTLPHDKKPLAQRAPGSKKPEKKDSPELQRKKLDDRSGATAGRGSSSGSSRNPAASEWSSKDRVAETADQEFEEEEDVDDEESESEARGGLQPNLRDRRPPVNRDLTIGFGNRPNPDANGRGGPSQRKKSRGVASLVLGVPIPDHVRGQPNPGRVKITQERVRPQREAADEAVAEDRGRRDRPVGYISRRILEPWMRRIIREYFDRTKDETSQTESDRPGDSRSTGTAPPSQP